MGAEVIKPQYRKKTGSITSIGGLVIETWEDNHGFNQLRCLCVRFWRTGWCAHVDSIYSIEEDPTYLSPSMLVQIVKSPRELIVPVLLLDNSNIKGMTQVKVIWGDISGKDDTVTADGGETVGYILRQKQGHKSLQTLLVDWLMGFGDQNQISKFGSNSHVSHSYYCN